MFELHSQLQKDCIVLGSFDLCQLLLVNDTCYPWFILVPQRPGISEIFQLDEDDQRQLMLESNTLSALLYTHFVADKMNVAALGNMVPQLHIHHIVRYRNDAAWPQPVWGVKKAIAYEKQELSALIQGLKAVLAGRNFQSL